MNTKSTGPVDFVLTKVKMGYIQVFCKKIRRLEQFLFQTSDFRELNRVSRTHIVLFGTKNPCRDEAVPRLYRDFLNLIKSLIFPA